MGTPLSIEKKTLEAGTFLYRAANEFNSDFAFCGDTNKTGKYFGLDLKLPLGIFFEKDDPENLSLGVYKLKKDKEFTNGKYSYRKLVPEFDEFSPDSYPDTLVAKDPSLNISHYHVLGSILNNKHGGEFTDSMYEKLVGIEVFISSYEERCLNDVVTLVGVLKLNLSLLGLYLYIESKDPNDLTLERLIFDNVFRFSNRLTLENLISDGVFSAPNELTLRQMISDGRFQ